MIYSGLWGDWTDWTVCPEGFYIAGVNLKIQSDLGSSGDDTGVNGVVLNCQRACADPADAANRANLLIYEGPDGAW